MELITVPPIAKTRKFKCHKCGHELTLTEAMRLAYTHRSRCPYCPKKARKPTITTEDTK